MSLQFVLAVAVLGAAIVACSPSDDPERVTPAVVDITDTAPPAADRGPRPKDDPGAVFPPVDGSASPPGDDATTPGYDSFVDEQLGRDLADRDPFAIPEVIDKASVELVINELLAGSSALTRDILQRPLRSSLQEHDVAAAQAIYDGPYFRTRIDQLQDALNSEDLRALAVAPDVYGVARFEVVQLGGELEGCVVAFGWPDASETAQRPYSSETHAAYVLKRERSETRTNPTGWRIWDGALLLTPDDQHIPQDAWADLDVRDVLDTSCGETSP